MMKQVTRDIDPKDARDLLERVPRARLAFAHGHGPMAVPVAFVWSDDRYLVGIAKASAYQPEPGQEVALLIDEGVYYFDLRAIYIRGQARQVEAPPGAQENCQWFEVHVSKAVAWDYGSMREV